MCDKVLTIPSGPDDDHTKIPGSLVGRILYERFLVQRDIADLSFGGRFNTCVAKDLRNFCRTVVLKIVNEPQSGVTSTPPSYEHLTDLLSRLEHRNIEEILETGVLHDRRPYSVSRLVAGETLCQQLKNSRRFPLERAARIIEALSKGLGAAHTANVLHCDVSPANVMIADSDGPDEEIRLINFGCSWPVDFRREGKLDDWADADSIRYAAPELLVKLGHRSPASDIYSLAVVAYTMLVGKVPFDSADRDHLLAMIESGRPDLPTERRTDLSGETERIILEALRFESARRPQGVEDFGSRLAESIRPHPLILERRGPAPLPNSDEVAAALINEAATDPASGLKSVERLKRVTVRPAGVSDWAIAWSLILLLLAGALSIPIGQTMLVEGSKGGPTGSLVTKDPENTARRQIRYTIESPNAGDTRSGGPSHSTLLAAGNQQLAIVSDTPGDLYVLKEFSSENDPVGFQIIFPYAGLRPVSPGIEAGKPVRTSTTDIGDGRAAKAVWVIWTAVRNEDLEAFRNAASGGQASAEDSPKIKHFLERNKNLRVDVGNDATGQTILNGAGDRIVHRIAVGSN